MDSVSIVTATLNVATHGIATAIDAHTSGTTPSAATTLSPLKLLHLSMICRVATNVEIPAIWGEVAGASTKHAGLSNLVQHLIPDMVIYQRVYIGHSDLLHYIVPLYNFVVGGRFVDLGENPE